MTNKMARGYALITILLLAGFFMTVAGAIGSEVITGLHNTRARQSGSTARFAAYAGLQHAILAIRNSSVPADGRLEGYLMPGSSHVSYAVYIINNTDGSPNNPIYASDGTEVPPGTIYCVAMGVDGSSTGGDVALHAMSGTISDGRPILKYAAFADHSLKIEGSVESLSIDSATASFTEVSPQPNGIQNTPITQVAADTTGDSGDLGTNRYLEVGSGVNISGSIHRPPSLALTTSNLPNVVDLANPEEIPRYNSPATSQNAPPPPSQIPSPGQDTAVYSKLDAPLGTEVVLQPGRYFFRDGMDIAGTLSTIDTNPDNSEPVVIFLGGDATLADTARVNLGKSAANIQIYFVDDGGEDPLKFKMDGNSQFFGTVVGNRAEGEICGQAEFYGGFLGRSMTASGSAKLVYDQSLHNKTLGAAANWGLNGITEPQPEKVLNGNQLAKMYVQSVKNKTVQYKPSIGMPKNNPTM